MEGLLQAFWVAVRPRFRADGVRELAEEKEEEEVVVVVVVVV